ncbi:MAG: hypothetical protein C4547_08145 [Phycisphaerales bacterium]|nr:MAG: hypothetical protein C4547_08145 [Phycisphaerales bacterium]
MRSYRGIIVSVLTLCIVIGCGSLLTGGGGSDEGEVEAVSNNFSSIPNEFSNANIDVPTIPPPDAEPPPIEDSGEETLSFFKAFQIDPQAEDSAGPKFVQAADVDKDGLLDLVSAWNQSQPVQLHLQRRDEDDNISFRTITLGGTSPIALVAGVEFGQINDDDGNGVIDDDDWLDVVILSKATGVAGFCPKAEGPVAVSLLEGEIIILFSPGNDVEIPNGDRWTEMILVNVIVQDPWIHNQYPGIDDGDFSTMAATPELGGFTSLVVADIDGQNGDDIIVALNPAICDELGQEPPINTVDLWINPGPGDSEIFQMWGPNSSSVPVTIFADAPMVRDLEVMDIDSDGDLDIIATYTNSISQNIRWARNPLVPHFPGGPSGPDAVSQGGFDFTDVCVGGANEGGACDADADCLGVPGGVCTAGSCVGGTVPGGACTTDDDCPGATNGTCAPGFGRYMANNWELRPIASLDFGADVMTLGDVDADGADDVIVRSTAGQIVQWFRRPTFEALEPEFPPPDPVPDRFNFPWQVYTLTEFSDRVPGGVTAGDIDGDRRLEVLVAAAGAVLWFDESTVLTPFDPWIENTIIQDETGTANVTTPGSPGGQQQPPGGSGVGVTQVDISTIINGLLIVDLDGDGFNDVIGTLDRRTGAGLSDDRLVWYRNTLGDR